MSVAFKCENCQQYFDGTPGWPTLKATLVPMAPSAPSSARTRFYVTLVISKTEEYYVENPPDLCKNCVKELAHEAFGKKGCR